MKKLGNLHRECIFQLIRGLIVAGLFLFILAGRAEAQSTAVSADDGLSGTWIVTILAADFHKVEWKVYGKSENEWQVKMKLLDTDNKNQQELKNKELAATTTLTLIGPRKFRYSSRGPDDPNSPGAWHQEGEGTYSGPKMQGTFSHFNSTGVRTDYTFTGEKYFGEPCDGLKLTYDPDPLVPREKYGRKHPPALEYSRHSIADGSCKRPDGLPTYKSLDSRVVAVDSDGYLTGVSPGKVTITATHASLIASAEITVVESNECQELTLDYPSLRPSWRMTVGSSSDLPLLRYEPSECVPPPEIPDFEGDFYYQDTYSYQDLDPTDYLYYEGVDRKTGIVTALKANITVIVRVWHGTLTSNIVVIRVDPVACTKVSVRLQPQTINVLSPEGPIAPDSNENDTAHISISGYEPSGCKIPSSEQKRRYESEDSFLAPIDEQGQVTGKAPGKFKITAYVGDLSGSATLTVLPPFCRQVSIRLEPDTIHEGDHARIYASYDPEPCTHPERQTFIRSADPSIATVDDKVVTGISAGETMIDFHDYWQNLKRDYLNAQAKLTVLPKRCAGLQLVLKRSTILVGEITSGGTLRFTPTGCRPAEGEPVYSSSDPHIAAVDEKTSEITGVAAGTASISVHIGNLIADAPVTVEAPACASLRLSLQPETIEDGQSGQVSISYIPAGCNPPNDSATYISGDPKIVGVNAKTGGFTAFAAGTTSVSVAQGRLTGEASITVVALRCKQISLHMLSLLMVGEKKEIIFDYSPSRCEVPEGRPILTMDNPALVRLEPPGTSYSLGKLVGVAPGPVTLNVAHGSLSDSEAVTVVPRELCTGIDLFPTTIYVGEPPERVKYRYRGSGMCIRPDAKPSFSVSDPAVAAIDSEEGLITAVAPGETIFAMVQGDWKESAKVTVNPRPACDFVSINFFPVLYFFSVGDRAEVTPTYRPAGCLVPSAPPQYASSAPDIVKVDETTGTVTALSSGDARITMSHGSLKAADYIHVESKR